MPRYEKHPTPEELNADAGTVMAAIRLVLDRDCETADRLLREVQNPHHVCALLVGMVTGLIEANAEIRDTAPEQVLQAMALDIAERGIPHG